MSFDYRFEPPTTNELEEMGFSECPFEYKCDECEYDCEQEEKNMMNQIEEIIAKYLNIQIIGCTEDPEHQTITFDLYDYLDKPGNFESDVKDAVTEIKAACPQSIVEPKFYNDAYWNGEEMEDTYNCVLGIIGGEL